jgi:hypothetical protein
MQGQHSLMQRFSRATRRAPIGKIRKQGTANCIGLQQIHQELPHGKFKRFLITYILYCYPTYPKDNY